jgi:hypothetical protein
LFQEFEARERVLVNVVSHQLEDVASLKMVKNRGTPVPCLEPLAGHKVNSHAEVDLEVHALRVGRMLDRPEGKGVSVP